MTKLPPLDQRGVEQYVSTHYYCKHTMSLIQHRLADLPSPESGPTLRDLSIAEQCRKALEAVLTTLERRIQD